MKSGSLAILGTSRGDGDTRSALARLIGDRPVEVIDLSALDLTPFDYDHENRDDAFLPLARRMTETDVLLFATPVYWYAMSAQMKVWFDRTSDLISIEKPIGRALAGTKAAFISVGIEEVLPEGFEVPFRRTFEYFSMEYLGCHYVRTGDNAPPRDVTEQGLQHFADRLWGPA